MVLRDVAKILDAKILSGEDLLDKEVESAFGCDLMSDVLAFVNNKSLLLTGLMNPQVVRTAEMLDIPAIVFVRGKEPDDTTIEIAKQKGMVILTTKLSLYVASGKLYLEGLVGENLED